ncbi:MAG: hypothetical protein NT027_05540 [Proteobacteria bacterium]|nr:hypothetical protein [Pseudomonadota bacterium]
MVKKRLRPSSTWLGGIVVEPIACLRKLSTTRILVNDVIINKIAGATDKIVRMLTIFIAGTTAVGSSDSLRFIFNEGTPVFA